MNGFFKYDMSIEAIDNMKEYVGKKKIMMVKDEDKLVNGFFSYIRSFFPWSALKMINS